MFILRTLIKKRIDGKEELSVFNQSLGDEYEFICRSANYTRFIEYFELVYGEKHSADENNHPEVTGFIVSQNDDIFTLKNTESYYVMTESGKTFEKIYTH